MNMHIQARALCLVAAAATLALPGLAQAASSSARVQPELVAPGQSATLTVTTDEEGVEPSVPQLAGLRVRRLGQQTQLITHNGLRESSTSFLYSVAARQEGDLVIEGIRVGSEEVEPVTLHVSARAAAATGAGSLGAQSSSAALGAHAAGNQAARHAALELRIDRHKLYAGEMVPFTAQATFRADTGVTVTGAPVFRNDAFVVTGLDQTPKQTQTTIDGEPALVVSWHGLLTAAKPGQHSLQMSLPVSLQYREQVAAAPDHGQRTLRDLFGGGLAGFAQDPFFDAMLDQPAFAGFAEPAQIVSRDVTLRHEGKPVTVSPLPAQGRPSDFSGAIGQFEMHAALAQSTLTQGEPVELQLELRGIGNFGRFSPKGVPDSDAWKAYAPRSEYVGKDPSRSRGTLTLRQPLVAQRAGRQQVPSLHFSYFDPLRGRYVSEVTAPIPVEVTAAPIGTAQRAAHEPVPATVTQQVTGPSVSSLIDGGVPRWLWPLAGGALLFGLLVGVAAVTRRSARYGAWRAQYRSRQALRRSRAEIRRAASQADTPAFVRAGRVAVQERLAAAWELAPGQITVADLHARWPSAPASFQHILELADRAEYAAGATRLADEPAIQLWAVKLDADLVSAKVPS